VKKSVREKMMKMSEIIREDSVQDVDQSVEDDYDQLSTFERSSLHGDITEKIDSKTSEVIQIDLKEDNHQEMNNLHTDMNKSFDQRMNNLHTDMKESQSFKRSSCQFRKSQFYQSIILTTKLFTLSKKKDRYLNQSNR
jgi:hypothetical protein